MSEADLSRIGGAGYDCYMNPLKALQAKLKARERRLERSKDTFRKTGKGGRRLRQHQKAVVKLRFLIRKMRTPHGISTKGAKFISTFEGFCPTPVNIGDGVTTVGIGKVIHAGGPTAADRKAIWIKGQKTPGRLTFGEALKLFQQDLSDYEAPVYKLFRKGGPLHGKSTPWRFDALVSACYNLGPGAVTPGTANFETIGRAITAGSIRGIAEALPLYSNPGSVFHIGLLRRRRCEARLLLTGNYSTEA